MEIFNFILCILVTCCIIMCILSYNLIHSIFWLTASFLSSSLYLLNLNIYTIAVILIIIYVGAIAIMFVFSILMVDLINLEKVIFSVPSVPLILIFCLTLFLISSTHSYDVILTDDISPHLLDEFKTLGIFFFNYTNYTIIGSAVILLIPMIGALIFI